MAKKQNLKVVKKEKDFEILGDGTIVRTNQKNPEIEDLAQENMVLRFENEGYKKTIKELNHQIEEHTKDFKGLEKDLVFIKDLQKTLNNPFQKGIKKAKKIKDSRKIIEKDERTL